MVNEQETKAISGVPGLASIPGIRRLFSSESIQKSNSELLIALVPRIVRTPELDDLSYKGIASGNLNTVKLTYASRRDELPGAKPEVEPVKPETAPAVVPVPPTPEPEKPAVQAPAGVARVLLSPEKIETQSGATFTVNLQVENVKDLFSAPVRIKFDPNVVRLEDVTRGSFLAADAKEILFTRNIINESGDASLVLSRMPGNTGVSGSGSLAVFTFRVVGKGVTVIAAPQISFRDSQAAPVLTASPQVTVVIK